MKSSLGTDKAVSLFSSPAKICYILGQGACFVQKQNVIFC